MKTGAVAHCFGGVHPNEIKPHQSIDPVVSSLFDAGYIDTSVAERAWSSGEFGRPKCWYRDVSDPDKAAEVAWLRENVMGPNQAVWALRITARDRYSDRCWGWGERLNIAMKALPTALEGAGAV